MVRIPADRPPLKLAIRLADLLASVRLAVVLMFVLAGTCIWATFYEVSHGTAAVQRLVYGTVWFALLLTLLGVNVFASMMKRYPWNRHHAGFVLAHVGILLLLGGSLVTTHAGLDGQLALYEGETSDRLVLPGEPTREGPPQVAMPFAVTLLRFRSDKYPGSRMAATYESRVRIDDPERGPSERLISMNHPLHYRGYIFFQASYVEGSPMMSIFSVARSPGLPLVYLGTALISIGVIWMFYVKPYLARRQGRAVLATRAAT
jgi:ResB-like family